MTSKGNLWHRAEPLPGTPPNLSPHSYQTPCSVRSTLSRFSACSVSGLAGLPGRVKASTFLTTTHVTLEKPCERQYRAKDLVRTEDLPSFGMEKQDSERPFGLCVSGCSCAALPNFSYDHCQYVWVVVDTDFSFDFVSREESVAFFWCRRRIPNSSPVCSGAFIIKVNRDNICSYPKNNGAHFCYLFSVQKMPLSTHCQQMRKVVLHTYYRAKFDLCSRMWKQSVRLRRNCFFIRSSLPHSTLMLVQRKRISGKVTEQNLDWGLQNWLSTLQRLPFFRHHFSKSTLNSAFLPRLLCVGRMRVDMTMYGEGQAVRVATPSRSSTTSWASSSEKHAILNLLVNTNATTVSSDSVRTFRLLRNSCFA